LPAGTQVTWRLAHPNIRTAIRAQCNQVMGRAARPPAITTVGHTRGGIWLVNLYSWEAVLPGRQPPKWNILMLS